jgi:hypothetical protein
VDDFGSLITGPVKLPASFGNNTWELPNIASNGSGWMLARKPGSHIYLLPIDAGGQPAAQATLVIGSNIVEETPPAIASDGSGYLIVWHEPGGTCNIKYPGVRERPLR